jgi:hypothetical protein
MNLFFDMFRLVSIATRAAQYAQEGKAQAALALMKAI